MLFGIQIFGSLFFILPPVTILRWLPTQCKWAALQFSSAFTQPIPLGQVGWSKRYGMSSVISVIVQCPIPVSSSEWPKAAENKNALQKCIKISISHKRLLVQPWWSQTWRGTGDIAPGQIYAYTRGIPGYPLWNKESKCLYFKEEESEFQREAICPRSHDKLMRKLGLPNME